MDHIFYRQSSSNFFDRLVVDVNNIYKDYPFNKTPDSKPGLFPLIKDPAHRLYRSFLLPLKLRRCIYHALRRTNLDQIWFDEFKGYWSKVLNGRPLHSLHDLFFLKNLYRVQFQDN